MILTLRILWIDFMLIKKKNKKKKNIKKKNI